MNRIISIAIILLSSYLYTSVDAHFSEGEYGYVSVKDKNVKCYTTFALNEYNRRRSQKFTLIDIYSAKLQIDGGENYELIVTAKKSNCNNNCAKYKCAFVVLVQDWLRKRKLLSGACYRIWYHT